MKLKASLTQILFICLIAGSFQVHAQVAEGAGLLKYRVVFKDKAGTPFHTSQPEMFLSARALERRNRQQIPVSENDLPVNPAYVEGLLMPGVHILNRSRWMNSVSVLLDDSTLISRIHELPYVKSTQKIARTKAKNQNDQRLEELIQMLENSAAQAPQTKNAATPYGMGLKAIEMTRGNQLHQLGYKGEGMTIAVLDAGFQALDKNRFFDSLRLSGRLLGTRDFVDGGHSVYEDNSHGTSVLSTMAANIPGHYIGTAPRAQYWLLRSEDADTEYPIEEDNWVSAAEFADSVGADIINSSLGYTRYDDASMSYTYKQLDGNTALITRAADIAASKGMLVVNSAGNSGANSWKHIGVPADGDSVLSVGAVNDARVYAPFSSRGPTADGRIKPNVALMGQSVYVVNASGNVVPSNGTSFSSPLMAGLAACLWQAHPEATAMQVFKAIEQSSDRFLQPDDLTGFGIPDLVLAHSILSRNSGAGNPQDSIVSLYPNPFIEGITLELYSSTDQTVQVEILSNSGKRIARDSFKVLGRINNLIQMEQVRRLKQGEYLVSVQTTSQRFVKKIIRQ